MEIFKELTDIYIQAWIEQNFFLKIVLLPIMIILYIPVMLFFFGIIKYSEFKK